MKFTLSDGSVVSLGPKSKLLLQSMDKKSKTNVMGILKGVLRAEVTKEKVDKPKLMIKTRSAVMGVRGTTFKTVFNPATNNTSLVTIEGEVAMAKVEAPKPSEIVERQKEIIEQAEASGDSVEIEKAKEKAAKITVKDKLDTQEIQRKLAQEEEVVSVTKGEFSGVVDNQQAPTEPAKIAPKQLVALVKSDEMADKVVDISEEDIIKDVYSDQELEEVKNKEQLSKSNAPRAGGLVDFQSGLYVPPPKDSKFDEEKQVFIADEKIGNVDNSGNYIPPKGVRIDEKKGFVVDTKEGEKVASNEELSRLQNTVGFLNNQVKDQVKKDDQEVRKVTTKKSFWKDWFKVKNHLLAASLTPSSEKYNLKNTSSGSESSVYSDSISQVNLRWSVDWMTKWQTDFNIGFKKVSLQDPDNASIQYTSGQTLNNIQVRFNYQFNNKLSLFTAIGDEESFYFLPNGGGGSIYANRASVMRLSIGGRYRFYDFKKFQFFGQASLETYGSADLGDDQFDNRVASGGGLNFQASALYDWSSRYKIEGLVFFDSHEQTISDYIEQQTLAFGIGANLIWDI